MAFSRSLRITATAIALIAGACGANNSENSGGSGAGGSPGTGGSPGDGGKPGTGGDRATGGTPGSGGRTEPQGTGGKEGSGGAAGATGSGGQPGSGGAGATSGSTARDAGPDLPRGTGGLAGGGAGTSGGAGNVGGGSGSGGGSTGTGVPADLDCNATMPSGGQQHSGNSMGGSGNLAWQIWSNQGSGTMTTFSTPAFSAAWNNSGDYLGRLGYEWGNGGKTYDKYGTLTADFTYKKSGSAGGFSYIGIYGWSNNPCVEWYIIDDSYGTMPFNPYGGQLKGSPTVIDGESYKFYSNNTNGTGGSRCNASSWLQFWSIRQKARQCGRITISEHFKAWDALGMKLGNLLEAKILVETGGGSGKVDFPVAKLAGQ